MAGIKVVPSPEPDNPVVNEVALDAIDEGRFPDFRKDRELKSLTESIRAHGVLQPIRIKPGEDGSYTIIAGHRRYAAAKVLGMKVIPAIVGMPTDDEAAIQSLVENLERRALAPLEEAEAFRALLGRGHLTQSALGARIGRRQSHISNSLRLLNQPESVRAALASGTITVAHAKAIAALPEDRQQALVQRIVTEKMTSRSVEREVAEASGRRRQTVNKDELARLAVQVALDAPLREGPSGRSARIPWSLIREIRAEADKQGIDWRKYHRQTVATVKP